MATDYHRKPVLYCRVPAESLEWARGEAERREQPFGDFVDGLIAAERDRAVSPAVDPSPAAAEDGRPERPAHKGPPARA